MCIAEDELGIFSFFFFFFLITGAEYHRFCSPPQVARAGRFGTKGLAVTFVSDETDAKTLNDVQDRFEVNVAELPEEIDISTYSKHEGFISSVHPKHSLSIFIFFSFPPV